MMMNRNIEMNWSAPNSILSLSTYIPDQNFIMFLSTLLRTSFRRNSFSKGHFLFDISLNIMTASKYGFYVSLLSISFSVTPTVSSSSLVL
jgi:hypothetical protein